MMKLNEEYVVVELYQKKIITRTTILEHRYEEKHSKTKNDMIQEFRNLQMEHESNLSEISAKHEHAIAMMKRKHDDHIRSLESKHLKYVSKMSDTKDTKLNDLEKRLSKIVTKRVEPRVMKWYVIYINTTARTHSNTLEHTRTHSNTGTRVSRKDVRSYDIFVRNF